MSAFLCSILAIFCASHVVPKEDYDPTVRLVLPIEAFGGNGHIKNYRKSVPAPEYFDLALGRAFERAALEEKSQGPRIHVTVGPYTYRSSGIDMRNRNLSLDLDRTSLVIYGSFSVGGKFP